MLNLQQPHPDDPPDHMATQAEADREFVQNVAYERREQAWILSDRDVWYANPAYRGPRVPHPESLEAEFGEGYGYDAHGNSPASPDFTGATENDFPKPPATDDQDDIPF